MERDFQGSMVALVTPFKADKSVDWEALERLIDRQLEGGTDALIVCGTTGEAATMSLQERNEVLAFAVQHVKGKIPIIAGTGSNNTKLAIEASLAAKKIGVDGLLVVTPPYNKPTQEGLLLYYNEILDAVQHPLILYNVPGRTASNLLPDTVAKLAENPFVVAIKEATGSMVVGSEILEKCGENITLLSGDDFTAYPLLAIGARGWISVSANVAPQKLAAMYRAWQQKDLAEARSLHYQLLPLHRLMFLQSNPIPVKAVLAEMGLIQPFLRSPLVEMKDPALSQLREQLAQLKENHII